MVDRHHWRMARRPRLQWAESAGGAEVIDLYDYMPGPKVSRRTAKRPRPRKPLPIVTDDWPEIIPITKAELDLIEVYFADFFDELLSRSS